MNNNQSLVSVSHRNASSIPAPLIACSDDIEVLTDEELAYKISELDSERNEVITEGADARPWDEELCYFRREMQIRRKRREIHETFLNQAAAEARLAWQEEQRLPNADLDNSSYMFIR